MSSASKQAAERLCLLMLMTISHSAFAFDESLSFRASANGNIEAVVSGLSDGPGCQSEFLAPTSVEVNGSVITITSPPDPDLCALPFEPKPYRVVANLGHLAGQSYQVTWSQGSALRLTGQLVPSALRVNTDPAPALSLFATILMMFCIVLVAARLQGRASKRPPDN